jgi:Nucleotidyltransferase domain
MSDASRLASPAARHCILRDNIACLTAMVGRDCEVWLIGSRVTGKHKDTSDYDLFVMGDVGILAMLRSQPDLLDPDFDVLVQQAPGGFRSPWGDKVLDDLDWQLLDDGRASYTGRSKDDDPATGLPKRLMLPAIRIWPS